MAAIYMWRQGEVLVITTTPYPIDYTESLEISVSPVSGDLFAIPQDYFDTGIALVSGELNLIRFDQFVDEEGFDTGLALVSGQLNIIRFDVFAEEEAFDTGISLISGTLIGKVVEGDTPDESLEVSCTIESDCSMTAV